MRKLFLTLVFSILTACGGGGSAGPAAPAVTTPAPDPQALQVYLFMGQSNMVGVLGEIDKLPASLQGPQAAQAFLDGRWVQYSAGLPLVKVQPGGCVTISCFGPEVAFGPRNVGIVKYAVSGTSLASDWLGAPDLLTMALTQAKQAQAAIPVHYAGVFWMQGESDTNSLEWANAYAANLRTLVARVRAELGDPNLPFTVCRINPPQTSQFIGRDAVRAAQTDPGITNYHMVDCDGLPLGPDALHFTTAGIVQMGELFSGL